MQLLTLTAITIVFYVKLGSISILTI